ncbi:cytochrome P450 [Streptomyces sp. NPDC005917]|uniref:cytochrome P450 n=1 Tax=Streptomyces sp. NPDC005917 TaxID=3155347 RepID=UPI0033DC9434
MARRRHSVGDARPPPALELPVRSTGTPRGGPGRTSSTPPGGWTDDRPAGSACLPFDAGPRVCPGAALTMRQLTLTTSRLARRFTSESPNAASLTPKFVDRLVPATLRARFLPVEER